MFRLLSPIIILVLALPIGAQAPPSSGEIPQHSTPQSSPCSDQPKSGAELAASFKQGQLPLAATMSGIWVEIGEVSDYPDDSFRSLNCSGEMRGSKLEFVLIADGYSAEIHAVGTGVQKVSMQPDHNGNVTFLFDEGADEGPDKYRCRLTRRKTLACLADLHPPYSGIELKKMTVRPEQIS